MAHLLPLSRLSLRLAALLAVVALSTLPARAQTEIDLAVPDGSAGFGASVAVRGDYAAVGAPLTSSSRGAVYLYRFDGTDWLPDGTILAPDGAVNDAFGTSISVIPSGWVAVGAPLAGTGTEGSVYLFQRTVEGAWVLRQTLRANFGLGAHVVMRDTYLAASGTDATAGVRTWQLNGTTWVPVPSCTRPSVLPTSLAISSPYLVYATGTTGTVLDLTTCTVARTFTTGTNPRLAADLDRIAYVGDYDLKYRPDISGTAEVGLLDPSIYGDVESVAIRQGYIAAASRLTDTTPELFVLRQTETGEWGVYQRAYPTTSRPRALAITGRFLLVGAPNGSAGRAFFLNLLQAPFFDPPVLHAPAAGATDQGTPLSFEWGPVALAQSYVLEVDNNPTFASPAIRETGLTDTTFLATNRLAEDRTYYWRVRADRANQAGPWSTVRQFTTAVVNTPGPPTLVAPANSASNVALTTILRWNAANLADEYQVQLSRSADFSDIVQDHTVAALQLTVDGLERGRRYWWRVRSGNEIGFGAWSLIRSFTTIPRAPVAPTLVLPVDGATDVPRNPLFVWTTRSQLATYQVQVSRTPDFAAPDVNAPNIADTTYQVQAGLQPLRLHYWRVRAVNGSGTGDWSATSTFVTGETVGTGDETPDAFAFSEPMPNPSSGRVSFALRLPAAARVRLAVYDVLGREAALVADSEMPAGVHALSLDGARLAAGTYVVRLTAGANVETRRLTLAR